MVDGVERDKGIGTWNMRHVTGVMEHVTWEMESTFGGEKWKMGHDT